MSKQRYISLITHQQNWWGLQTVSYVYDHFGNVGLQKYNGTTAFERFADRSGNVIKEKDYINNYQFENSYDNSGNILNKHQQTLDPTANYPTGTAYGNVYEYYDTECKDPYYYFINPI